MKLSIQHMQKTWKNHGADMDQRMERFTQTLIEQIESLASIAGEFSNFAKMPKPIMEKINLQTILLSTIDLYTESPNVRIIFSPAPHDVFVFADKEQLMRVFNNLLQNAIQAIPGEREGVITFSLLQKEASVLVEVQDNGTGIRKDQLDKIFVPNFTTKTGGTGLGLAIVKNIVESFNGKIWFQTEENKGTSFYVSLPLHKDPLPAGSRD